MAGEPGFLRREADEGREPLHQAVIGGSKHGAAGAARHRRRRVAIEHVLADVEVQRRQIHRAEVMQLVEHTVEVIGRAAFADGLVHLLEAVEHPALQLRHLARVQALSLVETGEVAEQIAQRVAQAAVEIAHLLDDVGSHGQVRSVVRAHDPQAQDVRARLIGHVLGGNHVAHGLGHLAALLVEHEAMGEHRVERRPPAGAAGFQQRGVEPAAMLVRALEIKVRRPFEIRPLFQHEGMGRS